MYREYHFQYLPLQSNIRYHHRVKDLALDKDVVGVKTLRIQNLEFSF